MPDHIHLMVIVRCMLEAQRRFRTVLATVSRSLGTAPMWQRVPPPDELRTPDKALRTVRYVSLNACRPWLFEGRWVRLVDDPLRWPWSTYRDVMGTIADPWIDAPWLARHLGVARAASPAWLHGYVSSDTHVSSDGTPLPLAAPNVLLPARTFEDVLRAVESATRQDRSMATRRGPFRSLLVGLARDQGYRGAHELAAICRVAPRTIPRLAASCSLQALHAARLCLGDERLRAGVAPRTSILETLESSRVLVARPMSHFAPLEGLRLS